MESDALAGTINFTVPGSEANRKYAASYLVVRYFDETNGSGKGIKELLQYIKTNGGTVNDAMDALGGAYESVEELFDAISDINDIGTKAWLASVLAETPSTDTGAIGGGYVTGDTDNDLTPAEVIKGNGVFNLQPIAGVTIEWPAAIAEIDSPLVVEAKDDTLQSVKGTLLLHSPLAGRAGKMTISGDENLIKALGFAEIQEAEETVYAINVSDAHTGNLVTSGRITGTMIKGMPHANVDVRLLNNFNLSLSATGLLGASGSYVFSANADNSFIVHLASQSVVFQIGANEGESMTVGFGDTGSFALGVDHLNVLDREVAARAITLIDNAIDKVSMKRARLGAYQNRLEHTIANLTVAGENLTAAESRIRDTDMAKEMMNFTKLQIMLQAGTSMLAQANSLPQNVLALMR
jgi:flagellin-like hook-associated protein FlgL